MGIGSLEGGLYYFDELHKSTFLPTSSNSTISCFVSSQLWLSRLGHPADQVLMVLKWQLNLEIDTCSSCEIFHKAKQIRENFLLSYHKSNSLG